MNIFDHTIRHLASHVSPVRSAVVPTVDRYGYHCSSFASYVCMYVLGRQRKTKTQTRIEQLKHLSAQRTYNSQAYRISVDPTPDEEESWVQLLTIKEQQKTTKLGYATCVKGHFNTTEPKAGGTNGECTALGSWAIF